MILISSSISISLLSMYAQIALMVSEILCGAILVAIPTAIPWAPLIKRYGKDYNRIYEEMSMRYLDDGTRFDNRGFKKYLKDKIAKIGK